MTLRARRSRLRGLRRRSKRESPGPGRGSGDRLEVGLGDVCDGCAAEAFEVAEQLRASVKRLTQRGQGVFFVVSAESWALADTHRRAQSRLAAGAVSDVGAAWRLLDPGDLSGSFPGYADVLAGRVQARRALSSGLGVSFFRRVRDLERVPGAVSVLPAAPLVPERLMVSLAVTGPVAWKSALARGASPLDAQRAAQVATAGAVQRHVLSGGRDAVLRSMRADDRARGYQRVSDGKPCAFCAMLVSRGAVYKSEASGGFRTHDGCGCSLVPFWELSPEQSAQAEEFRALWDDTYRAGGYSAFRRAYERGPRALGAPRASRAKRRTVSAGPEVQDALAARVPPSLRTVADDALAGMLAQAERSGDWDTFDAVSTELDRRELALIERDYGDPYAGTFTYGDAPEGAFDAPAPAVASRSEDVFSGGWGEGSWGDSAEAAVYRHVADVDDLGLEDWDLPDADSVAVRKRSPAELRRDWEDETYERARSAEEYGGGIRPDLRAEADRLGISLDSLFEADPRVAYKYANQELLQWWADNGGRRPLFEAQHANGQLSAAKVAQKRATEDKARATAERAIGKTWDEWLEIRKAEYVEARKLKAAKRGPRTVADELAAAQKRQARLRKAAAGVG